MSFEIQVAPLLDFEKIRNIDEGKLRASTLPILFNANKGVDGLAPAVSQLCQEASKAIKKGATF